WLNVGEESRLLQGLRVGICCAVPAREHWDDLAALDQATLRFVSTLSALVMKYGGTVVHTPHPSFTPLLTTHAQRFAQDEERPLLTLIVQEGRDDRSRLTELGGPSIKVVRAPIASPAFRGYVDTPAVNSLAHRLRFASELDLLVAI